MMGKFTFTLLTSSISGTHLLCESKSSTEIAIAFTPRFAKSPANNAVLPSSVVQTGVKSAG